MSCGTVLACTQLADWCLIDKVGRGVGVCVRAGGRGVTSQRKLKYFGLWGLAAENVVNTAWGL